VVKTVPVGTLVEGIASWYGPHYDGKQTSSGERFDQDGLTAAHFDWAFGTQVRVTLLSTGRSVVVRINDRFPRFPREDRIIDLSRGAARAIGLIGPGTGRVRLEVVGPLTASRSEPIPVAPPAAAGTLPEPNAAPPPVAGSGPPKPEAEPAPPPRGQGALGEDGLEYAWIPAGAFQMGCVSLDPDCGEGERPRHGVTISQGFWAARTESTVGAFGRFVRETGYETTGEREHAVSWKMPGFAQDDRHPVVNVSWDDAVAFCAWAGGRLPTEAEWEYMARGGKVDSVFPWDGRASHDKANYAKERCCGPEGSGRLQWEYTAPVGSFPPNGFGLSDAAGNVDEWVADWYSESFYTGAAQTDPKGPPWGEARVLRGGGWDSPASGLRTSARKRGKPGVHSVTAGFRCVRDASP
jgi:sulfatase modifying factor 1